MHLIDSQQIFGKFLDKISIKIQYISVRFFLRTDTCLKIEDCLQIKFKMLGRINLYVEDFKLKICQNESGD